MINIAICDDEEQEVETMYNIVSQKFDKFNAVYKITKCSNGGDLLYEMDEIGAFDLVFLDIELGIDNGIDAEDKVKQKNPYCYIIFVSGYDRYYKAAFGVQPFQFLDKPINRLEVERVIDSVANLIVDNNSVYSFEHKWKQYRIPINTILYFISDRKSHVLSFGKTSNPQMIFFQGAIGNAYISLYAPRMPYKDEIRLVTGVVAKTEAEMVRKKYQTDDKK